MLLRKDDGAILPRCTAEQRAQSMGPDTLTLCEVARPKKATVQ